MAGLPRLTVHLSSGRKSSIWYFCWLQTKLAKTKSGVAKAGQLALPLPRHTASGSAQEQLVHLAAGLAGEYRKQGAVSPPIKICLTLSMRYLSEAYRAVLTDFLCHRTLPSFRRILASAHTMSCWSVSCAA